MIRIVKCFETNEAKLGILSINRFTLSEVKVLENRNTNITQELSRIFKAFSDFRLVAQIREEIERVKPSLAFTTL